MREIWQVDSENAKKHFQDDQKKIVSEVVIINMIRT